MGRRACCDKIGLKKGPWSADEDKKLREFILSNGTKYCWRAVPKNAELLRCGKSCRLRWANYLRPDLKNDRLSKQEEKLVIDLHSQFGNKWSKIASHLNGRTDNYIKNYWHNHIKKQLCKTGIDSSITHKPLSPNKSQKKANKISRGKMHNQYKGRQEIYDETSLLEDSSIPNYHNHHLANEKLTLDAGFSIHEIPLIKPHEILIPPHSDLSSHYCSSSSNLSTPTASTTPSSSTINLLIVEKLKSLPYWHGIINDYCRNNNGNIGYSNEDDFTEWNSLINELDIDKIDHELFQPPPSS